MKRVQLILDEWQHDWLAQEAKKQGKTISALTRQLLTQAIELHQAGSWQDDPIWGIVGLGVGPDDDISSENLDDFLYPPVTAKPALRIAEDDNNYSG